MARPIPDFTPVNLLTGFLGSGKTTLLQRLLKDEDLSDCAVLINEFGEIGLDHHLLERIDDTMVLLQSGCLCCTIRGELAGAIKDLHSKRERGEVPPFQRIIVESTGLADPFPILSTIHSDPVLKHHFRLGNVITTVDAVNAMTQLDRQEECARQIAVSDRLVLTKTDLADAALVDAVMVRIRSLNAEAPLWRGAEENVPASELIAEDDIGGLAPRKSMRAEAATPPLPPAKNDHSGHNHSGGLAYHDRNRHDGNIRAFSINLDGPIDWTAFGIWLTMLLNRHGANVLRVKGILNVAGSATPVAVHGVQHLVHPPVHMRSWPNDERHSRLVFIVRGLDRTLIERSLVAMCGLADTRQAESA